MRLIDFHCDTILRLMENKEHFELRKNNFSVDIEKLIRGKSLAQFFALFIELEQDSEPLKTCLEMSDKFYTELEKNSEEIAFAKNYEDIMKNSADGKISALLTIEEGGALEGKMYNLRTMYRLGVRLITLLWNTPNEIGYPNFSSDYREKGLTDFGKELVCEMNGLGMIIDVSHMSDGGFYDVVELSSKPFIASHSNARAVTDHPRNLTDEMIKVLANKGGLMGINFEKSFLGTADISRVDDMIAHIKHIKNVGGIDVIGIGSDFDGISPNLEINNIGEIGKLVKGLQTNGFSEYEIEKIMYKNALRVIKDILH
jgi:membrane dipeptidase